MQWTTSLTTFHFTIFSQFPAKAAPTWICFSCLIIELQIKAWPNLVSDSQQMHSIWPRHWVHNSDSNYASLPISEMVTSHRGDTLVWQGLKYRQCPTPIAQSPPLPMPGNEAWPNISSHLHTQHHPSSSACSGAVNNLCISITEGAWVAKLNFTKCLLAPHATDIFLAERAAARHLFFSIAGNLWAIWPSIHFHTFSILLKMGWECTQDTKQTNPYHQHSTWDIAPKLYSLGCIHEWISLSFETQTLELRMIERPGEKCWPIFQFVNHRWCEENYHLGPKIWELFQTDQHQYWGW